MKKLSDRLFSSITGVDAIITDENSAEPQAMFGWMLLLFLLVSLLISFIISFDAISSHVVVRDRITPLIAFLLIPTGGYLSWFSFKRSETGQIAKVLRAYIFGAFMFSGIYFCAYSHTPSAFSFASGISNSAELQRFQELDQDMSQYYRKMIAINKFFAWIEKKNDDDFKKYLSERYKQHWEIEQDIKLSFRARAVGEPPITEYWVIFEDKNGSLYTQDTYLSRKSYDRVSSIYLLSQESDISKDNYLKAILELKKDAEAESSKLYQELAAPQRYSFNLIDFVYFSFITVTTVGFGDIVPNATWIRVIIICQILFGMCLILAASSQSTAKKTKRTYTRKKSESNSATANSAQTRRKASPKSG